MQTFRTLWAHKLRSFFTMFGIAWGVGSLLLLVGMGEGFRSGQAREMDYRIAIALVPAEDRAREIGITGDDPNLIVVTPRGAETFCQPISTPAAG